MSTEKATRAKAADPGAAEKVDNAARAAGQGTSDGPRPEEANPNQGGTPPTTEEAPPAMTDANLENLVPRDRLIEQAVEFTGYQTYEVAGALFGEEGQGPGKELFDPKTVKQMTKDWLEKPEVHAEEGA